MSLTATTGPATYDITAGTGKLDLSEQLAEIIRSDNTVVLNRLFGGANGIVATQIKHQWNEDKLNPNTATINDSGGISAGDSSVTVTTGHGVRFKDGTLFKDAAQNKSEVMLVTGVSSNTLTITRGYGSTSGETHADGATLMIIAHTKPESWKPTQEDWTQERSSVYNYTQIFGRGIAIPYSRENIEHAGIKSELAHQTAYRLKEIMRELSHTLINGIRSADAGSDTSYHTMAGLIEWASQSGGNTDAVAENFTETIVNDMVKQCWDDGAVPDFILVSGAKKRTFSTFDQAYRRMDFNSKVAGFTVERFISDLGAELEVIVDPWMPDSVVIIGERSRLAAGPLSGDSMRLEALAKTGRLHEAMVTGQYTCEARNATEALAIHTNLN